MVACESEYYFIIIIIHYYNFFLHWNAYVYSCR